MDGNRSNGRYADILIIISYTFSMTVYWFKLTYELSHEKKKNFVTVQSSELMRPEVKFR